MARGMYAKSCWGRHVDRTYLREKMPKAKQFWGKERGEGQKQRNEAIFRKNWAPVTRKKSWIRHPWYLSSTCLTRHLYSYPPLLKLWWQALLCASSPLKPSPTGRTHGVSPGSLSSPCPSYTKHQFSNKHWHSTARFTHLSSQPLPQGGNQASRQGALS